MAHALKGTTMDNYHRAPEPFFRGVALPQARSVVQELYPNITPDQAEAQADKLDAAGNSFEVINGRLVQVRDPVTGAALIGAPKGRA